MTKDHELVTQNNIICYALDCDKTATENIDLSAGNFGIITLKVCKECSKLFNRCEDTKEHSEYTGIPTSVYSE